MSRTSTMSRFDDGPEPQAGHSSHHHGRILSEYEKQLELPPRLRKKNMIHQIDSKNLSFEKLPSGDIEVKRTRLLDKPLSCGTGARQTVADTLLAVIPKSERAALAQFLVES